ncbi:Salicylate hydroxylase [Grifola frondosa]|uniref:Salicylate hydroxylase n=1 Tax=Grifola frondosa TaxID=5627 RepID=A0A1C7MSL8_GRIFR|nr:Salicylate hydroxylase [Grifola frondosa]
MGSTERSKTVKDFQVAIVGGGVCGLVCAIALTRAGVPVELFEAAPKFGEIGAGIGVAGLNADFLITGPNAVRVLRAIGILQEVLAKSSENDLKMRGCKFISGMEGHDLIYDYPTLPEDIGIGIHRAAFLDALVGVADPAMSHFNKRCTSITTSDNDRLLVHFADGTTHETDIVLGADGIKSNVRNSVIGDIGNRIAFSNTVAYRGLVPDATLKAAGVKTDLSDRPVCFVGQDKASQRISYKYRHLILFPIRNGEIVCGSSSYHNRSKRSHQTPVKINIVAFTANHHIPIGSESLPDGTPWVERASQEELLKEYEGWGSDVPALLGCIQAPSKWSIHVVYPPLETYVRGRIALLGDAAHGMLPHLGAGAGQGLEDALLLSRLLSHPETKISNIEAVLQVYDNIRRPRSQMVWKGSDAAGELYDGCGKHGLDFEGIRQDLQDRWTPVWRHDLDGDFEAAIKRLRELEVFTP